MLPLEQEYDYGKCLGKGKLEHFPFVAKKLELHDDILQEVQQQKQLRASKTTWQVKCLKYQHILCTYIWPSKASRGGHRLDIDNLISENWNLEMKIRDAIPQATLAIQEMQKIRDQHKQSDLGRTFPVSYLEHVR